MDGQRGSAYESVGQTVSLRDFSAVTVEPL